MNRPLRKAGFLGLAAIFLFLVMQFAFYRHVGHLGPAIIAFQFAKTPSDVVQIFHHDGELDHQLIQAVDAANRVDFLFFTAYCVFLWAMLSGFYNVTRKKMFYYTLLLPVLIFLGDFMENLQMFHITEQMGTEGIADRLILLRISAYTKWLGLALVFSAAGLFCLQQTHAGAFVLGVLSMIPLGLGIIALISGNLQIELIFANSVVLAFAVAIAYCFGYKQSAYQQ